MKKPQLEFQGVPMSYTLTEAIEVPPDKKQRSKWDDLIDSFLERQSKVVRLEFDWPEGTTVGQTEAICLGVRHRLKVRGLANVQCMRRRGELFLLKTDEVPIHAPKKTREKA